MSFQISNVSGNIFSLENWERLAKITITTLIVSVITIFILSMIHVVLYPFPRLLYIIDILMLLAGNIVILSFYEEWRGCNA
jgi:hypothetical protein